MNCRQAERWILMETSGELTARRRRRLARHRAGCDRCGQFATDTRTLTARAADALPAAEPSQRVLVNIRREARVHASGPGRHGPRLRILPLPWQNPVAGLAYAMALVLIVGVWWLAAPAAPDRGASDLDAMLALVAEETGTRALVSGAGEPEDQLRFLAQELLALQGLGAGLTDEEISEIQAEELPATDPQSRSNAGVPRQIRV